MDSFFTFQIFPSLRWILYLLLLGVAMMTFFEGFKRYGIPLIRYYRKSQRHLERWLPVVETLLWLLYVMAWAVVLIQPNPLVGILFLGATIAAFWYFFRDLVAGLVIRTWSYYHVGQKIRTESFSGIVTKLGRLVAEIETDRGEVLVYPYYKLSRMPVIRQSPSAILKSRAVDFSLRQMGIDSIDPTAIRNQIRALPWSIPGRDPVVEILDPNGEDPHLRLVLYGIDDGHLVKVEKQVEAAISGKD